MVVPGDTPVMTPVAAPTGAIATLLLVQLPPPELIKVPAVPVQIDSEPVMAPGGSGKMFTDTEPVVKVVPTPIHGEVIAVSTTRYQYDTGVVPPTVTEVVYVAAAADADST